MGLGLGFGPGFGCPPWTSKRSGEAAPVAVVSSSEGRRMRNSGSLEARPGSGLGLGLGLGLGT